MFSNLRGLLSLTEVFLGENYYQKMGILPPDITHVYDGHFDEDSVKAGYVAAAKFRPDHLAVFHDRMMSVGRNPGNELFSSIGNSIKNRTADIVIERLLSIIPEDKKDGFAYLHLWGALRAGRVRLIDPIVNLAPQSQKIAEVLVEQALETDNDQLFEKGLSILSGCRMCRPFNALEDQVIECDMFQKILADAIMYARPTALSDLFDHAKKHGYLRDEDPKLALQMAVEKLAISYRMIPSDQKMLKRALGVLTREADGRVDPETLLSIGAKARERSYLMADQIESMNRKKRELDYQVDNALVGMMISPMAMLISGTTHVARKASARSNGIAYELDHMQPNQAALMTIGQHFTNKVARTQNYDHSNPTIF